MKSLVFGASTGVGRALTEDLGSKGSDLFIISSSAEDLQALASHLMLMHKIKVEFMEVDASLFTLPDTLCSKLDAFGRVDRAYFPVGFSSENDFGVVPELLINQIINANFLFIIKLIEELMKRRLLNPLFKIVGFGSIASIRGRTNNKIYSAAKSALETYFQSLSHQLSSEACGIYFFKLGYINTQQTFGRDLLFPSVDPKHVSQYVEKKIAGLSGEFFFPPYWLIISLILKSIPRFIFNKLKF